MVRICPICGKRLKTKDKLIIHLNLKHSKKLTIVWTIAFFILGMLVPILFSSNISYYWDKMILKEEPDLYLSMNMIKPIVQENFTKVTNESEEKYLSISESWGMIPNLRGNDPMKYSIDDPKYNSSDCCFFHYANAMKEVDKDEIPDFWSHEQTPKTFHFTVPRASLYENICESCYVYQLLGGNSGNREIEWINFEICLSENKFILNVSDKIEKINDHCFRVKRKQIIGEESFLGELLVESQNKLYYDSNTDEMPSVSGKYSSKEKEFDINKNDLTLLFSQIITNCSF